MMKKSLKQEKFLSLIELNLILIQMSIQQFTIKKILILKAFILRMSLMSLLIDDRNYEIKYKITKL
nr:MAG TPA: hypothetical protein [Caudoviricetes sp.]